VTTPSTENIPSLSVTLTFCISLRLPSHKAVWAVYDSMRDVILRLRCVELQGTQERVRSSHEYHSMK
jgi:hypothetical protein